MSGDGWDALKKLLLILVLGFVLYRLYVVTRDPDELYCLKVGPQSTYFEEDANGNMVQMPCDVLPYKDGDLQENDGN